MPSDAISSIAVLDIVALALTSTSTSPAMTSRASLSVSRRQPPAANGLPDTTGQPQPLQRHSLDAKTRPVENVDSALGKGMPGQAARGRSRLASSALKLAVPRTSVPRDLGSLAGRAVPDTATTNTITTTTTTTTAVPVEFTSTKPCVIFSDNYAEVNSGNDSLDEPSLEHGHRSPQHEDFPPLPARPELKHLPQRQFGSAIARAKAQDTIMKPFVFKPPHVAPRIPGGGVLVLP